MSHVITQQCIYDIVSCYRPSHHSFFQRLISSPRSKVATYTFLDELYTYYQAAMHATRVMVYHLPMLDDIVLRQKKISIISEDDAIPNGDTHHFQLRRTWTEILIAPPSKPDAFFGDLELLKHHLADGGLTAFISLVQRLYSSGLGGWLATENLAHDWIGALLRGLEPHFPNLIQSAYFANNYANEIELEHGRQSIEIVNYVLSHRPSLELVFLREAEEMARGYANLWTDFERLLFSPQAQYDNLSLYETGLPV